MRSTSIHMHCLRTGNGPKDNLQTLHYIFKQISATGDYSLLVERFADDVVCFDIGENGEQNFIFRGKQEAADYFTLILPGVKGFDKTETVALIPSGKDIIVLGHPMVPDLPGRAPDQLHAMIVRFSEEKIIEIKVIENLGYPSLLN